MNLRIYLRTLINDIITGDIFRLFVNICYKHKVNTPCDIKFARDLPIYKKERSKSIFFRSITGDEIDCK